jgi:hypothetical protein
MKMPIFSLFAVACLMVCGCATCKKNNPVNDNYVALIRITANVDGSDRFFFTPDNVSWEHKFWGPPTDVTFDGQPWADLNHAPPGWRELARPLDLRRAWIVNREGRDVIALEHTSKGFELYFCDSPNGAGYYEVTIAVPLRAKLSNPPLEPAPTGLDR